MTTNWLPPAGDSVLLKFGAASLPPAGDNVLLQFGVASESVRVTLTIGAASGWGAGAVGVAGPPLVQQAAARRGVLPAVCWQRGALAACDTPIAVQSGRLLAADVGDVLQSGRLSAARAAAIWQGGRLSSAAARSRWQAGALRAVALPDGWRGGALRSATARDRWQRARRIVTALADGWRGGKLARREYDCRWETGRVIAGCNGVRDIATPPVIVPPYVPPAGDNVLLRMGCPISPNLPGHAGLRFGLDSCVPWIHITRSKSVQHSLTATIMPAGTAIALSNLQLSLDIDSYYWSGSASIRTDQLALVQPGNDGELVELDIVLNGQHWRMLVMAHARDARFASDKYTLKLAGPQVLLGAPHSPVRSTMPASWITAQQLALQALPGDAYMLQWGVVDWSLPPNLISINNRTAVEWIADIARAAGGVVTPARNSWQVNVVYRYPTSPWQWDGAPVVATLDHSAIDSLSEQSTEAGDINAVMVAGTAGGVVSRVRRSGTAGDVWAEQIIDPLNCHPDPNRERGRNVLAAAGRRRQIDAKTIWHPALLNVGSLLQIGTDTSAYRAQITRCQINMPSLEKVELTVSLERAYVS